MSVACCVQWKKLSGVNIEHRSEGRSFDALATLAVPTRARLDFLILFVCLYPFEKNYRPDFSRHKPHAAITYVNAG